MERTVLYNAKYRDGAARPQDLGLVNDMSTSKERLGGAGEYHEHDVRRGEQRTEKIRAHKSKFWKCAWHCQGKENQWS